MARPETFIILFWLAIFAESISSPYSLHEEYVGEELLDFFEFEAIPDPTHGRVDYVNHTVAVDEGMVEANLDRFIVRADSNTVLSPNGPGRKSFRLKSKDQYGTSVIVFKIRHIPEGCGTWPAVWTVGMPWPNLGEIDIVEGVNDQGPNQITLHTSHRCDMPTNRLQTGTSTKNSCGIGFFGLDYVGCGVRVNNERSYGPTFNEHGGGWYAMERTGSYIKVWFWSRSATDIPEEVVNGSWNIDTGQWGTPVAYFPTNSRCDIKAKFGLHNVVVNLTFCGDWAGSVYRKSGCPSTCVDFVNRNPSAFKNAYFDLHSLRVYKTQIVY